MNCKTNSSILHILPIKSAYHEVEIDLNYAELGAIRNKKCILLLTFWQDVTKIRNHLPAGTLGRFVIRLHIAFFKTNIRLQKQKNICMQAAMGLLYFILLSAGTLVQLMIGFKGLSQKQTSVCRQSSDVYTFFFFKRKCKFGFSLTSF